MRTKKSLALLLVTVFVVSFFTLFISSVYAGVECPVGIDDCDCDGVCEVSVLDDSLNCGGCGKICASGKCVNGVCLEPKGGLVPCDRFVDDPLTLWNEAESCKLCHFIPLLSNVINYLFGIVALMTILAIIISGLLSVSSVGNVNSINLAKSATSKSLYGFVIISIAWVMVNVIMILFGFNDPSGDGNWAKFECGDLSTFEIVTYCGDGTVQIPNDSGVNEQCDSRETFVSYNTRTGLGKESWVEEIYSCNRTTCQKGCAGDPLVASIGKGCYSPLLSTGVIGGSCQKGQFVCDSDTNTVICKETYNDLDYKLAGSRCSFVYDYCCRYIDDPAYVFVDAVADLNSLDWIREKPAAAASGAGSFNCDNICKLTGKICIGVGLTNNVANACVAVRCHSGNNCTASANNVKKDCRTTYPFLSDSDSCTNPETYHVGYTSCLCY